MMNPTNPLHRSNATPSGVILSGTFPVIPTPFYEDQTIDSASFERVIEYIIQCGVDGVIFPGLASEYAELTINERLETTALVGRCTRGKIPFVVGASASHPEQVIAYSKAGAKAGAVYAMVMTPVQFADDLPAMIHFFQTLADEAHIPVMLQNAPSPMGAGLAVASVIEILRQVPLIHYVKEETMPCGQRIEQLLAQAPPTLKGVFGGAGGRYIIDELNRNASGTVPACELTEMHIKLVNAHRRGDVEKAREWFCAMLPILNMQAVYRCSLTKTVLQQRNIITSAHVRAPGAVMDEADKDELRQLWSRVEDCMGPLSPIAESIKVN